EPKLLSMIDLDALPIDITSHVINFRNFLNSSWPWLDALIESHDWEDDGDFTFDWIQANWEFLVERELLGKGRYLLPLEWNNRVTFPNASAQYKIVCEFKDKVDLIDKVRKTANFNGEELLIFGFRTPAGIYPPFDYAQVGTHDRKKIYNLPTNCC